MSIAQYEQRKARILRMGCPYSQVMLISFLYGSEHIVAKKLDEKYGKIAEFGFAKTESVSMHEALGELRKMTKDVKKPVRKTGIEKIVSK